MSCFNKLWSKVLPVKARIALLDTCMRKYQHACVGTIQTTLNEGTVLTIFYPNFCMYLIDYRLQEALKVQIQIVSVDQDPRSMEATLHYQMTYKVQNYALDLALPASSDVLMIFVGSH